MNNHEDSRAAFETLYRHPSAYDASQNIRDHIQRTNGIAWEAWTRALDWRDAQVCASRWYLSKGAEENPNDGTIVGECSGGQFVVFAPSKIPIYCPGCGRRVKIIENQTNNTNNQ